MTAEPTTMNPTVKRSFPYARLEELLRKANTRELPEGLQELPEQPLHWRSGEQLSESARRAFIGALLEEDAQNRNEMVRWVRPFLRDLDCYKLCRQLLEASDDHDDELWPLYIQAIVGSPYQVKQLARQLEDADELAGEPWSARDIIKILKRERSPEAMGWLHHWSQNSARPRIARACREALEELADEQRTSVGELLQTELPELYLNASSERGFDYGPRTIVATLNPDLSLSYREKGGRAYKSVPPLRRSDDKEVAGEARTALKKMVREIKQCVRQQTELLESAMCHGRQWPVALWRERFLIHPVMRALAHCIVFGRCVEGEPVVPFSVVDGRFVDLDRNPVGLPAGSSVLILHPIHLDDSERAQWEKFIANEAPCEPPFEQFKRPTFTRAEHRALWLSPSEEIGDIEVRTLRNARRKLDYEGSIRKGNVSELERVIGPYRAQIDFDLADDSDGVVAIDVCRCIRVEVLRKKNPVHVDDLPEAIFSEITTDLHTLIGRPV